MSRDKRHLPGERSRVLRKDCWESRQVPQWYCGYVKPGGSGGERLFIYRIYSQRCCVYISNDMQPTIKHLENIKRLRWFQGRRGKGFSFCWNWKVETWFYTLQCPELLLQLKFSTIKRFRDEHICKTGSSIFSRRRVLKFRVHVQCRLCSSRLPGPPRIISCSILCRTEFLKLA